MATDGAIEQLTALETERDALTAALTGDAAERCIASELAAYDASKIVRGVDTTVPAERAKFENGVRTKYDADWRERAAALEQKHTALVREIAEQTTAWQQPPSETNLGLDTMRQLVALQRWQGRTLADIMRAYQATPDTTNPTLIRLIETDLDAFKLRPDRETDATAVVDLRRAIAERRTSRIPEGYRGALGRAEAILAGAGVSTLLDHLRRGRGVATVRTSTLAAVK